MVDNIKLLLWISINICLITNFVNGRKFSYFLYICLSFDSVFGKLLCRAVA